MIIEVTINDLVYDEVSLLKLVPQNIFSTKEHVGICESIFNVEKCFSGEEEIVFKNLLCNRSSFAKCVTAIFFLSSKNRFNLQKIKVVDTYYQFISDMFDVEVLSLNCSKNTRLIDYGTKLLFISKYLVHSFYRFVGFFLNPKVFKNNSVLRAWVEVSESIHGKERCQNSTLLFYPFPYKIKRQFDFIKKCLIEKYQVGFSGIPYSFFDLLKILNHLSDKNIVSFESNAHIKHADFFLKKRILNYYTEDDYDASAFIIANRLISFGVNCVNTAHGVNQVTPFIGASTYEALTLPQVAHFSRFEFNKNITFSFQGKKITKSLNSIFRPDIPTNFVFIHGNFIESKMFYEHKLQSQAVKKLAKLIKKEFFFIKYHPNGTFREELTIKEIEDNIQLSGIKNICYIALNSTSYFTFGESGFFTFIGDDLCNPFNIIGNNVPFFKLNELDSLVKSFSKYLTIKNGFENQIKHLNLSRGYDK